MQARVVLRKLAAGEAAAVRRLAASRSEPAAVVQRARVIRALLHDPGLSATAAGRLAGFTREDAGARCTTAVQKPRGLGEPFALWTLERLQRAYEARTGVHLSDSTIWTWLRDEGLVWKRQQSWFHEPARHDPAFAEKRGPSSRRISPRRRGRASSASTSSGRSR